MLKFKKLHDLNKDNIVAVTTIRELVLAWRDGSLVPYDNNRGSQGVSPARVAKIVDNFDENGLGMFTMALVEGKHQLADAHTRMMGIDELADTLDGTILSKEVLVMIVPESELVSIYALLNDGKSHTGANKITNNDYLLGNIGHRITRQAGVEISPTLQQNMWDIIVASLHADSGMSLRDVYTARRTIDKEYIDVPADASVKLPISREQQGRIIAGLKYYKELMTKYDSHRAVSASSGKLQKDPYSLNSSSGLFITVFYDCMRDKPLITSRNVSRLASTIFNNAAKVKDTTSTVARRSNDKVNVSALFKAFGTFDNTTPEDRDSWKGE